MNVRKIPSRHKLLVYRALDLLINKRGSNLREDQVTAIVNTALEDLQKPVDQSSDYKAVIRNILIFLEKLFPNYIEAVILSTFQPGFLPDINILMVIAKLSSNKGGKCL
ncbi:hypothetical protein NDU88_004979 [Pleurodeles waltl]|uniref:MROH2B-like N-terminal HEAT-repeats domain-containing protein n=1 Tax=Pleurodeles waltl TaxID=8319 RepID=A0AAV7VKF5_PLEWA|nr:hypothetical protein NDU88_004979 [Pleurodeles waltl]